MSAPLGARSQKLYTMMKQTGMTKRKKTALKAGDNSAHGFQLSDFIGSTLLYEVAVNTFTVSYRINPIMSRTLGFNPFSLWYKGIEK